MDTYRPVPKQRQDCPGSRRPRPKPPRPAAKPRWVLEKDRRSFRRAGLIFARAGLIFARASLSLAGSKVVRKDSRVVKPAWTRRSRPGREKSRSIVARLRFWFFPQRRCDHPSGKPLDHAPKKWAGSVMSLSVLNH